MAVLDEQVAGAQILTCPPKHAVTSKKKSPSPGFEEKRPSCWKHPNIFAKPRSRHVCREEILYLIKRVCELITCPCRTDPATVSPWSNTLPAWAAAQPLFTSLLRLSALAPRTPSIPPPSAPAPATTSPSCRESPVARFLLASVDAGAVEARRWWLPRCRDASLGLLTQCARGGSCRRR